MGNRTTGQRWDGRSWIARVALPVTAIGATAFLPGARESLPVLALVAAAWVPLVSLTQRVRLRFPGSLPRLVALAVDLAALLAMTRMAPALAPATLVLAGAAGLLHAVEMEPSTRWTALAGVVVTQLGMGLGGIDPEELVVVGTMDVALAVLGALLLMERDRTRRRSAAALDRADQLTDAVLAGIGEAVVVTDSTGRITSTNEAAEVTFGQPVQGRCELALQLHHGAGTLDCSRGCPLLDEDAGVGQADVSRDHPSGTRQALLANVQAVRDPLGRVREVVHSYRDITRMKQAEQAKTLFLATASHELKTPLAVISGFVTLLAQDSLDPERRRQAIETIEDRTEQLSGIIDRLLLASRIEGGGLTIRTQPTSAAAIVEDRIEALREVTEREIELTILDDTGEPVDDRTRVPPVDADETGVATVVDHLVENGVKYSPDGGAVRVTMRTTETDVLVDVADQGVGMSRADAEHCFDAFWQAESDDTRRFGGSGVGLYIVRSLSRAMGGDTEVHHTVPGEGTTFRFTLRRANATAPEADRPETGPDTMVDEFMRQVGVTGG